MSNRSKDERGAASAFIIGMTITLFVVAGLVVDGGGALNAKSTIADDAEAAAVAGAQATDELALRGDGVLRVDPAAAQARASEVLLSRGYPPADYSVSVSPDNTTVTVVARDTVATKMLLLIGFDEFEFDAEATAEAGVIP